MNCYLFGAGDYFGLPLSPSAEDLCFAVDGGLSHLLAEGLKPNALIGDFDSSALPAHPDCRILRYPVKKDETDMQLAISHALRFAPLHLFLLGGTGGRTDHTLANLACLAHLAHLHKSAFLFGKGTVFTAIKNTSLSLSSLPFALGAGPSAVFAFGADARGVTIRGLAYEAENETLFTHIPTGVSNYYDGKAEAEIAVKEGVLLLMLPLR